MLVTGSLKKYIKMEGRGEGTPSDKSHRVIWLAIEQNKLGVGEKLKI